MMEVYIKKQEQASWKRLTKSTQKFQYIGVDWNNWVDSDEEAEDEEPQQGNYNLFLNPKRL